ncbi:putative receptor protein kinase ZmPK1 [Rhodamnia argentea]|uniref:Receptor-like serine/threonine-protein kinase n=1 Tax=Rhodamnia argentea TaxID=178133 RepID=A0A8B8Q150_9MYRT|nr:putative receptor protein kinase ZmPK1 [Rhodamnia argentea]
MRTSSFLLVLVLSILHLASQPSSGTLATLRIGDSLSVDKPDDILVSKSGIFSAGFYPVGKNAYCFAIWFSHPPCSSQNCTVVWTANRDKPVNGRYSKLSLKKNGDLVLTDARHDVVWTIDTASLSWSKTPDCQLQLLDSGNLVLRGREGNVPLWQSFDYPTDVLLPEQNLTRNTTLVSSRSNGDFSSGYYKLYFDNDNVLRLLFDGPLISSVYWPDPSHVSWEVGRTTYNDSRVAVLDSLGNFTSSDDLKFLTSDFGKRTQRILKVDHDGNVRVYSRRENGKWVATWQAISESCTIHGICGPNSVCSDSPSKGRRCSCLPGYVWNNDTDWTQGCMPEFESFCNKSSKAHVDFLHLPHHDFYGYDKDYFPNTTLAACKKICADLCNCKGFQYKFQGDSGYFDCFPKLRLLNGYSSCSFIGSIYLKLPKANLSSYEIRTTEVIPLPCPPEIQEVVLQRTYLKSRVSSTLEILLIFASVLGGAEIVVVFLTWSFLIRTDPNRRGGHVKGYQLAARGFRRFTYAELKKATRNFSNEIGRGSGGIVYKGVLPDHGEVAVKRLNEVNQGEEEFLAEVRTIGNLNHMNLIVMWGYCAEGKHWLLVYEFMDHGSLAENLSSDQLDWTKRYEIALGSARGLAYLHEECLEWVLHCDVKPHNILLDSNYQPKVADFGLSKILKREGLKNSSFSRIRGTRGYMAPEWVYNMPITSKVDVYSYGIVVLELVTGRSPTGGLANAEGGDENESRRLTSWVRERKRTGAPMETWIKEILDPRLTGEYDMRKIEVLVAVALQCVEEDREARPPMSQVVEMLLRHESEDM